MRTLYVTRRDLRCPVCHGWVYRVLQWDKKEVYVSCVVCSARFHIRTLREYLRQLLRGDERVSESSLSDWLSEEPKDS